MRGKKHLLILSYGGPRSEAEIEAFVRKVTSNRATPAVIESAKKRYLAIGGRSPVTGDTRSLAERLSGQVQDFEVSYAFRFTEPSVEEAVKEKLSQGFRTFYLLPLYPFYSEWSARGYLEQVKKAAAETGIAAARFFMVSDFYAEESYINIWKQLIIPELDSFKPESIVFTTHSLPLSDRGVSVYERQFKLFARLVAEKLNLKDYLLAYQSRGRGGGQWLEPDITAVIEVLAGTKKLLVVPAGFLQENLETLYDLDVEVKNLCTKRGIAYKRVKTPLLHPGFADFIKEILLKDYLWTEVDLERI